MRGKLFKSKGFIALIIVVLLIAVGVYRHSKNKKVVINKEVKNVTVQKISLSSITTNVTYPGKLAPNEEITISPKTPGKISAINVSVGDTVKKGQVLFTLDTTALNAQLKQQQAALVVAEANVVRTKGSAIDQQLLTSQQAVDKAQIAYNNANDNFNKMQQLYNSGAISKQEFDNSQTALNNASIDLKTAKDSMDIVQSNVGPGTMQGAEAQAVQAQAAVDLMKSQIDDASITSPIDGVISTKSIEIGEMASGTCMTVIDSKTLTAEINVPDSVLSKINAGQSVSIAMGTDSSKSISGAVDKISPNVDSKSNSYVVKVKVDNSNGDIKPGMFVKVLLPSQKKENILTVPGEAINIENGVNYIYIVNGDKVKKLTVTLGISDGKITEISGDGIKDGDNVITEGQNLISDGEKVNIAK